MCSIVRPFPVVAYWMLIRKNSSVPAEERISFVTDHAPTTNPNIWLVRLDPPVELDSIGMPLKPSIYGKTTFPIPNECQRHI